MKRLALVMAVLLNSCPAAAPQDTDKPIKAPRKSLPTTPAEANEGFAWLTGPIPDSVYENSDPKSRYLDEGFWRIADARMNQAIADLETTPIRELTWEHAERLVGHALQREEDRSPYLVRAVKAARVKTIFDDPPNPNVLYRVWHDRDYENIAVVHFTLGTPRSTDRFPLVVLLPRKPEHVYVEYHAAR